jgi:single-stranded DNA-binding protein
MRNIIKKEIEGKERYFGMIAGRLVKEPYIIQGGKDRKGKQDIAFLRVADNGSKEPKYFDIKVFGDAVKVCTYLKTGAVVAVNGEFVKEEDEYKGEKREKDAVLASYIEVLYWGSKKGNGTQIAGWTPEEDGENAHEDLDDFDNLEVDDSEIPF